MFSSRGAGIIRRCFTTLETYCPPSWAATLSNTPSHFVKLCQRNTPIRDWTLPGLPSGFSLSIKRDDMTGSTLSGNKVRKLEFLLADALVKGSDCVLTCGGIQSNHCRATAVAARELGLDCYLFLRHKEENTNIGCSGNLLLNHLMGAKIFLVPNERYTSGLKPRMEIIAEKLREKGRVPYIVPLGGSNPLGLYGYISAFQELIEQKVLENFDDIVLCIGSAGSAAGIAIGNYLTGSKVKCHAVCASDNAKNFYEHINEELDAIGMDVKAEDIIDIVDGYKGKGYGISTKEELELIVRISSLTGIVLDPVYTIKSVRGMLSEMNANPSRFKGSRVLYIHTGGVYGLYDGRMDDVVTEMTSNSIREWKDSLDNPPQLH
ncbi:putative D-cysteine desulfhydrase 1, mitochondrial [Exaiptasia diaphana]|uniref:D-cysteine desulfhydrase n=1 Tax=Exaiptasia diaphana TaxID=2652724 RepID=A0A913WSZ1_EXADI|nr:putative D-cysteine desulfhydrase 1, mitochondrial [Exaiptasia diaphana]